MPGDTQSANDTMSGLTNSFANADGGARWATLFKTSGAANRLGTAPDSGIVDSGIRPLTNPVPGAGGGYEGALAAGGRLKTQPEFTAADASKRLDVLAYNEFGTGAGAGVERRVRGYRNGISLAPEAPIDAAGMAADYESRAPTPGNPDSYMKAALNKATEYWSQRGERPNITARTPAQSGDFITSKYGYSSVKSGPQYDYEEKLKKLVATSDFSNAGF